MRSKSIHAKAWREKLHNQRIKEAREAAEKAHMYANRTNDW